MGFNPPGVCIEPAPGWCRVCFPAVWAQGERGASFRPVAPRMAGAEAACPACMGADPRVHASVSGDWTLTTWFLSKQRK